ncbi:MAG: caspase family protein [Paracoccaceae bacterium]
MLRRVFFAVFLMLGLASAALAERRVALVLGVEDYRLLRPLDNPVNDARAVEALLEGLGFEVWLETDRDLKRTRRALEDFRTDAAGADVALVFFAGHGVAIGGVNYLLPSDADASSTAALTASSLPLSEVQEVLAAVAPVSIFLLDACRDDPFALGATTSADGRGAVALKGDSAGAVPPQPGLGRIGRSDGVLFAFAAAPGETASDGKEKNSPFTSALMRHFGTAGVELKSALTLVQQDVYDRSRGRQLPYIESGLPALVFISSGGDLPERDQLLIAMADLTPDLRAEVEGLAAERDMPLAPLYAALISGDLAKLQSDERRRLLVDAADSYGQFQAELVKYASDDPRVADLRRQAEEQLTLGAFDAARALLTEAAGIDATARAGLKTNFLTRTLSEAGTHILNAKAARTDLRYDLAIEDLARAVELYAEVEADLPDRDTRFAYNYALRDLGDMQLVAGNTFGALGAYMTRSEYAAAQVLVDPLDFGWSRELVWSHSAVGAVLQQQGYLREAEQAYSEAYQVTAQQNAATPNDTSLMRDLETVLNKLGDLRLALNDAAGALSAFQEGLGLAQSLLETAPDDVTYNQDVSVSHERLGDVLVAMGDRAGARDAYDVSLKISQKLVEQFPSDMDMRRNLSVSYERLGDAMQAEGDLDAALASYQQGLVIREDLQAQDPANATRKRDSAILYERVGDIYNLMGDPVAALASHDQARAVRQDLVTLDRANALWARDLSVSHERIGAIYQQTGDYAAALPAFEACRDLRMAIVAVDPGNLQRQRDLGICLDRVGQVLAELNRLPEAVAAQTRALEVRRVTASVDPTVVQYQLDVSYSLSALAGLYVMQGDQAAAAVALREAIGVLQPIVAADPGDLATARDLSVAGAALVDVLLPAGDVAGAVAAGEVALAQAEHISNARPADQDLLHVKLVAANRLGDARRAAEDMPGAEAAFVVMVQAAYQLSAADPYNTDAAWEYALALERLGGVRSFRGDQVAARTELSKAVEMRDWLAGQEGAGIERQRELAYALQSLAETHFQLDELDAGRPMEERALAIMRWIDQTQPGQVWNIIDLATALDRCASYAADPQPYYRESLALLEGLQARDALPEGYQSWIDNYRTALGGN